MSVVLGCVVSALLLLLALSALVFHDSGLVHSYMSPSTVCGARKPFQEPPSFTGFLLDGQAAAAWVGLVGMATLSFLGFFFFVKTLVGRFMVCSSLAALLGASLVAIVGPAHCFQFVVLLLDAAMLELRVRVGTFLVVHEIFLLAGRTQSKEGSKTLVFKGERYVKFFSQAFCFDSVFLRARVAFGVLQQLCSCIVKSLSAALQCAGAAVATAIYCPLVCAFFKSSFTKGLAAASVSGFWKEVCLRAAAALFKALAGRFFGSGLFSFLLPGILEDWHVLGLRIQRAARIVEVTVRARQSKPSLRCGHVLGLGMLLNEVSRLGADKVLVQMRGCSRRSAAPNARDLDVIRRLAAVRARAAFDGVRGVADMDEDHGVELSVFAFPRIMGVKPQSHGVDAGKRPYIASKAEAEATPRVDVGEVSTTMVSRGERQNKPASFQVFA